MNKKGEKNTTLDSALERWSSLSESEKKEHIATCKPFVKSWVNKSKEKRIAIEYAITLGFLLLAVLIMCADSLFVRVVSLPIFFFTWGMFINIEKCSKRGADLLEGIIAMQIYQEEGEKP